jgi:6-phosphofructokinase 2
MDRALSKLDAGRRARPPAAASTKPGGPAATPDDAATREGAMPNVVTLTMNPSVDVSSSVDRVVPIRKLRCTPAERDPGGGGINVARALRALGGESVAVYPAGGATGALLRRLLARDGLHDHAVDTADETRESLTILEAASGQQYRFVLPGPRLEEAEWRACLEVLAALRPVPAWVVASGSLPRGVPEDFYAELARRARGWGARLALDTSGPALRAALGEGVDLVKPNLRELRDLAGRELADEAAQIGAVEDIVGGGGARLVALTLGAEGAILASREGVVRAAGIPVDVVSAVGAGDSFVAGMVLELSRGRSPEEAFRHAVAAGTAALLTAGTGLCRKEDADRLLARVRLSAP